MEFFTSDPWKLFLYKPQIGLDLPEADNNNRLLVQKIFAESWEMILTFKADYFLGWEQAFVIWICEQTDL